MLETERYFETKIINMPCNFDLLDEITESKEKASNYYAWVRDGYKQFFNEADDISVSKYGIRYYRAKKLMYSAAQMMIEANIARENECVVSYFFLLYYALFQAMQANLIISKELSDEKVIQLSHENVRDRFFALFCDNKKCPVDNTIIELFDHLRECREYFSYSMPFNIVKEVAVDYDYVKKWVSICFQLFELHCFIVWQDVRRSVSFLPQYKDELKTYLQQSCNRLGGNGLLDDADRTFWYEFQKYHGTELLPPSMAFEHDCDEYGTYDEKGHELLKMPRTCKIVSESMSFVYRVLF